jgi:hypothetical protein
MDLQAGSPIGKKKIEDERMKGQGRSVNELL